MAKNRIKLTESQLRDMIKESVKNVLNELDWKTYANASDKMRDRGNMGYWREKGEDRYNQLNKAVDATQRAGRLGQAAKDAFNRDFGYKNGDMFDKDYAEVAMRGDFDATEEFGPHAAGIKHTGVASLKEFPHGVYTTERTPEEFFDGNDDAINAYKRAEKEVRDYKKGNYKYQKGKGWQLKDA